MNLWFVIPNLNGKKWLDECLGTLRAAMPVGCVACVIDNGSTDGSVEHVEKNFPEAVLLKLPRNEGFVGATNLGTETALRAGADAVVYLNNDTRGPEGWVRELVAAAERHPELGILGPWQNDFHGNTSPRTKAILREAGNPDPLPAIVPAMWVEGSAMLVRRAVFEKVGMLDPLFFPAYCEEVELCRRARRAGFGIGMVPASVIEHFGAGTSTTGPALRRKRILLERNYLLYAATEPNRQPALFLPALATRAVKHGLKAWRAGELHPSEALAAWAGVATRLPAAWRKFRADRRNWACAIPR